MGVLENRMAASRAFSVQVGVLCARAIPGRWFRPGHAHRARAIAEDDVRGDHQSHDLEEVRGASLPPECENAQSGQQSVAGGRGRAQGLQMTHRHSVFFFELGEVVAGGHTHNAGPEHPKKHTRRQ